MNTTASIEPLFAARLTPYRSLSHGGFILLMAVISLICFVAGILFYSIGAWPIFGFFGLDVLLIYGAFKLNYRSARAYEDVVLTHDELNIRKVNPSGQEQRHSFNPFWVRLSIKKEKDEGVTGLTLTSHGQKLELGNFLNPEDRESFGSALSEALLVARSSPAPVPGT